MEQLFVTLTRALEGSAALALAASFAWGILSVVLSPCHLSSIPLIVGFIGGQGKMTTGRAFGLSSLFAVGILVTIGLIGVITALAGKMLGDVGPWGNYSVAAVFFLVGLHLLGLIPMPWSGPGQTKMKRRGLFASFILGLIFGIALGPCTFAFMAPVTGLSFSIAGTKPVYAALLLLAYGVGHSAVLALAGTSTGLVQRYLDWNEGSRGTAILRKICGLLVIIGGVYLITNAR